MLRKSIRPDLSDPPVRSRRGFLIEKAIIALMFFLWVGGAIFLAIKWFELPMWEKIILTVFEIFVTIDIRSAKRIFQTYEAYLREKGIN